MQIKINRADEPAERMQSEKRERADEQSGHRQKNGVEERIMFSILRIGVRIVFRETHRRIRMTFLAGDENICRRQLRARIGRRQNVVIAVAVVTGGDFRRDVWFAERHSFAVIGFAIMRQPIGVAFAATLVADGFEIISFRIGNFVRGVAIGANGPARISFGQQLSVNARVINFFNAEMALAAGRGDVGMINRRIAVHGAFDVVNAVAIVARRRDNQTHFQQRLPVNAVHVLQRRIGMRDLIFFRQSGIAVTFGAGERQIHFENRRGRIRHSQNSVRAVAIPTLCRAGRAKQMADAVNARGIIRAFLCMTMRAIRRAERIMDEVGDIRVAIHAIKIGVN